jgi:hypothetical protein
MKHCTKFQVSTISHFVVEVSTRFCERQTDGQKVQEQRQRGIIRPSILVTNRSFTPKSNYYSLHQNINLNFKVIPAKMLKKNPKYTCTVKF